MAGRTLLQLDALDFLDEAASGHRPQPAPTGYALLLAVADRPRRAARECPSTQTGVPFEIDPGTGAVTVSRKSQLFPMPRTLESK